MLVGDVHQSENSDLLVNITIRERASVHMHIGKRLVLDHLICLGLGVLYTAADYLIMRETNRT